MTESVLSRKLHEINEYEISSMNLHEKDTKKILVVSPLFRILNLSGFVCYTISQLQAVNC